MSRKSSKLAVVAATLSALAMVLCSSFPLTAWQRDLFGDQDKPIHLAMFALLTVCVAWALSGFLPGRIRILATTVVLVTVIASIDELAQRFVPTRAVELWDWLANCAGIAIGIFGYVLITLVVKTSVPEAENGI